MVDVFFVQFIDGVDVPVIMQRRGLLSVLGKVVDMPVVFNDRCFWLSVQETVEVPQLHVDDCWCSSSTLWMSLCSCRDVVCARRGDRGMPRATGLGVYCGSDSARARRGDRGVPAPQILDIVELFSLCVQSSDEVVDMPVGVQRLVLWDSAKLCRFRSSSSSTRVSFVVRRYGS